MYVPVSSSESNSSESSSDPPYKLCELENCLISFLIHVLTSLMLRPSRMLWSWFQSVGWLRPETSLNISLQSSSFTIVSTSESQLTVLDWEVTPNPLSMFFNISLLFVCEWANLLALVSLRFMPSLSNWFTSLTSCSTLWSIRVHPPGFSVSLNYFPFFSLWAILVVSKAFIKQWYLMAT